MIISVFSSGQDGAAHCWKPGQLVLVSSGVFVLHTCACGQQDSVLTHAWPEVMGKCSRVCAIILYWGPSDRFWQEA